MSEPATVTPWSRDDTERWLTDWPLPADLTFRAEKVWPRYQLKKGYGFWLRTCGPYHVALRGLFLVCHDILAAVPIGQSMPTPEQLAERIRDFESSQGELPLDEINPPLGDPPGLAAAEEARAAGAPGTEAEPENPL